MNRFTTGISAAVLLWMVLQISTVSAQAIDPNRSAKASAMSDAKTIAANMVDMRGMMDISQKAIDRGNEERTKEIAKEMLTDYTSMVYSVEQLSSAGTGSSGQTAENLEGMPDHTADLIHQLSLTPGADFDSVWVAGALSIQHNMYDLMTQQKGTVTNSQLKTSITDALPMIRKHVSQLTTLQKFLIRSANEKRKEAAAKQKHK